MEHGVRRGIVKNALRQLEVQLRGRDLEGVVALFREDGVLFGSEEHENAAGAKELRVFLSGLFARPHTYGWSELEPLFTGGNDELVWFVAPTTVIIQEDEGHEKQAPYRVSGVLDRAAAGTKARLSRVYSGALATADCDDLSSKRSATPFGCRALVNNPAPSDSETVSDLHTDADCADFSVH